MPLQHPKTSALKTSRDPGDQLAAWLVARAANLDVALGRQEDVWLRFAAAERGIPQETIDDPIGRRSVLAARLVKEAKTLNGRKGGRPSSPLEQIAALCLEAHLVEAELALSGDAYPSQNAVFYKVAQRRGAKGNKAIIRKEAERLKKLVARHRKRNPPGQSLGDVFRVLAGF